ncbi:MAG: DNA repair protein RadC [Planctomycetes bacterium]|nr:DNA repair protein RadC [Planctomycetota bacterium]
MHGPKELAEGADAPDVPEFFGPRSREPRSPRADAACLEQGLRRLLGVVPEELAARLRDGEVWALSRYDVDEWTLEFGLEPAVASSFVDTFRLARALAATRRAERDAVRSPRAVYEACEGELRGLDRETFHALALDGKHRLLRRYMVSVGTLTTSLVHPREVFRPALRFGAVSLVVVHNHPSGDPEPSPEDEEVTRRLVQAGRVLGVPLLDHVVIGDGRYVSLAERLGWSDARYRERAQRT